MTNKLLLNTATSTGTVPQTTSGADQGEPAVNLADRKIFIRDNTGAPVVASSVIRNHDPALAYDQYDLAIRAGSLFQAIAAIPPKAFDPADWTEIGAAGSVVLTGAIITSPTTVGRNTVNLSGNPTVSGLQIAPDVFQSANLAEIGDPITAGQPEQQSVIDALGYPTNSYGNPPWLVQQVLHGFTAAGQPVHHNGTSWVTALAGSRKAHAIIDRVVNINQFVLRSSGEVSPLQAGAFDTGVMLSGTTYYVSSIAGKLTDTPPLGLEPDRVLHTTAAPTGRLLMGTVEVPALLAALLNSVFPVGAVYMTAGNNNPSTFLGGTWLQIAQGRAIVGVGTADGNTFTAGIPFGNAATTLTLANLAVHNHSVSAVLSNPSGSHSHTVTPIVTIGTAGSHAHTINPPATVTTAAGGHGHTIGASIPTSPASAGSYRKLQIGGFDNLDQPTDTVADHTHTVDIASFNSSTAAAHTHTLTVPTVATVTEPSHTHTVPVHNTNNAGAADPFSNIQPSWPVYIWQRTA